MSRHLRTGAVHLDRLLATLPDRFSTCAIGEARLVSGPTGVYLVMPTALSHATDPEALAAAVRLALADHLTLAPFVHPMVVGSRFGSSRLTVVPPQLLVQMLTEGLTLIDGQTLDRIRELGALGYLDPATAPSTRVRAWAGAPSFQ